MEFLTTRLHGKVLDKYHKKMPNPVCDQQLPCFVVFRFGKITFMIMMISYMIWHDDRHDTTSDESDMTIVSPV